MDKLVSLVEHYGLALVWANVFLAQIGLPLPAVPTLLVAGSFAARGELNWLPLFAGAVTVTLIADCVWYYAGARYRATLLNALCRHAPGAALWIPRTESFLRRWGAVSIVLAKFLPGLALIAPPLAGMGRVRPIAFVIADTIAALLWAGLPLASGAGLRIAIDAASNAAHEIAAWGIALAIVGIVGAIGWSRRHRSARAPSHPVDPCASCAPKVPPCDRACA